MNLNLVVIRSQDIERLAKFYEKLGMEFEYHKHGKGPLHYSVKLDKTIFEIYPLFKKQKKPDNSLRLGFEIENLDELITKMRMEDIEIEKEPKESEFGYYAVIKDLDGRKIELKEKGASL